MLHEPRQSIGPTKTIRRRIMMKSNSMAIVLVLFLSGTILADDPLARPVRRLSRAEYTQTLSDLTKIKSLDDGQERQLNRLAADHNTNTDHAVGPSLDVSAEFLKAAQEAAQHAVLTPNGFKFSPSTTRQAWTDDALKDIREFYERFSDFQGKFLPKQRIEMGGQLDFTKYLVATIRSRDELTQGKISLDDAAAKHRVNAKYLALLWRSLNDPTPSLFLDPIRAKWRVAQESDVPKLVGEIYIHQKSLWQLKYSNINAPQDQPWNWDEPRARTVTQFEIREKLFAFGDDGKTLLLTSTDAGDGSNHDIVVWERPRFVRPGMPDLLLKDVSTVSQSVLARRQKLIDQTPACLAAATEVRDASLPVDLKELAKRHQVDVASLVAWLTVLGIPTESVKVDGHFKDRIRNVSGNAGVNGWGSKNVPIVLANSSDKDVELSGVLRPKSFAVRPTSTTAAVVGWRCPNDMRVRVDVMVQRLKDPIGKGALLAVDIQQGNISRRLVKGGAPPREHLFLKLPLTNGDFTLKTGDVVKLSLLSLEPNDAGLVAVDITVTEVGVDPNIARRWNLVEDVSADILQENPHADRLGNLQVWHFFSEDYQRYAESPHIPIGSVLAEWQAADATNRSLRAAAVQRLMREPTSPPPYFGATKPTKKLWRGDDDRELRPRNPNAEVYRQLTSLDGPLMMAYRNDPNLPKPSAAPLGDEYGLDPNNFGKHPSGLQVDEASLCVSAPSVISIRLPREQLAGAEFVVTGRLHPDAGPNGSVQLSLLPQEWLRTQAAVYDPTNEVSKSKASFVASGIPILVNANSAVRQKIDAQIAECRDLFPRRLSYMQIEPPESLASFSWTLPRFHRDDDHLKRLLLSKREIAELDRLWDDLYFISQNDLSVEATYLRLMSNPPENVDLKSYEPLRQSITDRAAALRQKLVDAEPRQLEALIDFAAQVYRRPLTATEQAAIRTRYKNLRSQKVPHEEAFRSTLAAVLVSPAAMFQPN